MTTLAESQATAAPARRLSIALSAFCLILIVLIPAATLLIPVFDLAVVTKGLGLPAPPNGTQAPSLTLAQHALVVLVELVPVVFVVYALVCARRCFKSFIDGEYFTSRVVGGLRGIAAGIALWVVCAWLTTPLLTILLTLGAEEHRLAVRVSSSGLLTLLFAGIVWQIAAIMTRAVALAEENSQFV
jgi:hypothetical protein